MRSFGPFDVDYIVVRDLVVKDAQGQVVTPTSVEIALVPAGAKLPTVPEWHPTSASEETGQPQLLLRGERAVNEDAVPISTSMDAHALVTLPGGLFDVVELGRVPYKS